MAKKVTQEDILEINRQFLKCGTYAATSRATGFSASTVKKYIIKDFIDPDTIEKKEFSSTIYPIEAIEVVWDLLTDDEQEEIEELWGEISL